MTEEITQGNSIIELTPNVSCPPNGNMLYPWYTTIENPFDPDHDYFQDLKSSEKYVDDKTGNEYPYLKGLIRLAHKNRGGVLRVESEIIKVPALDAHKRYEPDVKPKKVAEETSADCIAAVTVTYYFKDGTSFSGSADASYKAHEAPFNLHLTAVAESKAEARAIRRALMITKVAKEEIGGAVVGDPDTGPITDTQLNMIRKVAKRKKLSQADVLKMVKRTDLTDITQLTTAEGRKAAAAVNRAKAK